MEARMEKGKVSILLRAIVFFLAVSIVWALPEDSRDRAAKTEKLRKEIRLLNLFNGLDLTQEQMKTILDGARESQKLRDEYESALARVQDQMEEALDSIRVYLSEDREIPPQTVRDYHSLDREVRKVRLQVQERIAELAREIEESLEPHQLYQLQEFVPCIIPPKGEKRIGQAEDTKGLTRNLERIRRLPSHLYQQRKTEIVGRTCQGLRLHAPPYSEMDDEELRAHVESVFDRMRRLEDAEFEIHKERLAEELISPVKPEIPASNLVRKIAGFLLSEEAVTVLEDRLDRRYPAGRKVS